MKELWLLMKAKFLNAHFSHIQPRLDISELILFNLNVVHKLSLKINVEQNTSQ